MLSQKGGLTKKKTTKTHRGVNQFAGVINRRTISLGSRSYAALNCMGSETHPNPSYLLTAWIMQNTRKN